MLTADKLKLIVQVNITVKPTKMAAVDAHTREVIDMLGLVEDPAVLEEIAADLATHIGDIEAIRGNLRAM